MIFVHIGAGAGDQDKSEKLRDGFSELVKNHKSKNKEIFVVEANKNHKKLLKKCWKNYKKTKYFFYAIVPNKNKKKNLTFYYSIEDAPFYQKLSFDINHVRKSKSVVLSGGERRRLEIARTLATNPKYLLLDEPLTGIDPVSIEEIKIIIKKLKDRNIGILITDHNVRETLKIVDKVYIVNEGAIFYEGDPITAVKNEKIKKFYLGSNFQL